MRLENKIALVTGAGLGMGRAIACLFAAEGAAVIVADINAEDATQTLEMIGKGSDCRAETCDVANSSEVRAMFERVDKHYGQLDILVNNAGTGSAPEDGQDKYNEQLDQRIQQLTAGAEHPVFADHIVHMEDTGWQQVVDVNMNGTFFCSREAVRLMIKGDSGGSIISTSSTSGLNGEGGVHYCASKAAILGFTKSLARELAPRGIRVNAICPGPTNTRMMQGISEQWAQSIIAAVPMGRLGEPGEVAQTALFLASEDSSFFTGQTLACNGGMYMV